MYLKKILFSLPVLFIAVAAFFTHATPAGAVSPMTMLGDDIDIIGKLTTGGNVGIGTASPVYKLDVTSTSTPIRLGNTLVGPWAPSPTYALFGNQALNQTVSGNYAILQSTAGDTYINSSTGRPIRFRRNNADVAIIDSTGNVGIGTASPKARLDVNGQIIGGFGAQTGSGILDWNDATNARPGSGYTLLMGSATNGPGATGYYHPFSFEYGTKTGAGNLTQFAIPYATGAGLDAGLYFRGRYASVWSSWRKILSENATGNVGIGTKTPTAKLDVNGDTIRIEVPKTPASSTAACNKGDIAWDVNSLYVCVATNTWKKAALTAF